MGLAGFDGAARLEAARFVIPGVPQVSTEDDNPPSNDFPTNWQRMRFATNGKLLRFDLHPEFVVELRLWTKVLEKFKPACHFGRRVHRRIASNVLWQKFHSGFDRNCSADSFSISGCNLRL